MSGPGGFSFSLVQVNYCISKHFIRKLKLTRPSEKLAMQWGQIQTQWGGGGRNHAYFCHKLSLKATTWWMYQALIRFHPIKLTGPDKSWKRESSQDFIITLLWHCPKVSLSLAGCFWQNQSPSKIKTSDHVFLLAKCLVFVEMLSAPIANSMHVLTGHCLAEIPLKESMAGHPPLSCPIFVLFCFEHILHCHEHTLMKTYENIPPSRMKTFFFCLLNMCGIFLKPDTLLHLLDRKGQRFDRKEVTDIGHSHQKNIQD